MVELLESELFLSVSSLSSALALLPVELRHNVKHAVPLKECGLHRACLLVMRAASGCEPSYVSMCTFTCRCTDACGAFAPSIVGMARITL